jgi:hypothetical protein
MLLRAIRMEALALASAASRVGQNFQAQPRNLESFFFEHRNASTNTPAGDQPLSTL